MASRRVNGLTVAAAIILSCSSGAVAQDTDLATALMNSTVKIEAPGSMGTGFLLGQTLKDDPSRAAYVLVTAAHILADAKADIAVLHFRRKVGDGFERLRVPVAIRAAGKALWVQHPTADVAAMRVKVPEAAYVTLAPMDLLATDDTLRQLAVGPGEQLLVLGFPFGAESSSAGFPILRSGRIASYPLLPMKEVKTYLMDFQVFPGNSGGPVFLMSTARQSASGIGIGRFLSVVGLVSQQQEVVERIESLSEVTVRKHSLGLAVVVHAAFIRDTIDALPPLAP
jgi:S1-C subfamily serine protease